MLGRAFVRTLSAVAVMITAGNALAQDLHVQGRLRVVQGHVVPKCRMVQLIRSDNGQMIEFRIAETMKEDGVLAVALTALASRSDVDIAYDPGLTTGCGAEPQIQYISILAS